MDKEMQKREIEAQREVNLKTIAAHPVVSQDEWNSARLALMKREKQLMKLNDELAAEKRALPWVKVEKQYFFNSGKGKVSLVRRSQSAVCQTLHDGPTSGLAMSWVFS